MIEVIYKEDTTEQEAAQESFSMPRNVRQIGLANGDYRIYIEDYVYTFLCSLAEDEKPEGQGSVAVLTGEIQWTADMTCIFIKGAIAADGMEAAAEHIDFSENLWQKLQEDKDQYFPEQEIVLLDSLNKRVKFLNTVIETLGLTGIRAIHGRAEDYARHADYREQFDLCVSRAVANLSTLSEYCLPYVKTGGHFIPYKSGRIQEELTEAKTAIKILGGSLEKTEKFQLADTDMERSFVVIRKIQPTGKKFPRKAGLPSKEPIK